jgi:PAS domain S-box-containing protein
LYRQLTVASPDAIIVCDPQGNAVFVSPKAKELFLINDDTNISSQRLSNYVHPHDLQKSIEMFHSLSKKNVSFMPQLLLMREDGSDFFGEISAATVKDDEGHTTSIIMVIRDITERKINEIELIRAKEKAEESDKLKSSFLANMSHEIRTPINGIIGFLNFLADDNLSPKRRHEYITVVNNSSIQLVKLIDDIIDVAKIEARQLSIRPVSLHLNDLMQELQVFFETYLHANHKEKIALLLDDSGFIDPCVIFVDPMRLRQILTNLIGNAIKFTEKGYIGFGYRLLPPDKLEFWVEDSGIGLAADQLEIIFERFRQAELANSRRYGGTGLGLTISRSLVQMMGGDIVVESVEDEGSIFRFTISYLPVSPEDEPLLSEDVS